MTDNLKIFRKNKGLSMDAMSSQIGISKSLYEKVESGHRTPSYNFISKFKRAFPETDTNLFF